MLTYDIILPLSIGLIIFLILLNKLFPKLFKTRPSFLRARKRVKIRKLNETRCREYLEKFFNKPFPTIRPDWLKYPKTNKNLELDMYNAELKLACEYDGVQHTKFVPLFHPLTW